VAGPLVNLLRSHRGHHSSRGRAWGYFGVNPCVKSASSFYAIVQLSAQSVDSESRSGRPTDTNLAARSAWNAGDCPPELREQVNEHCRDAHDC
jgi:hypothetical protein